MAGTPGLPALPGVPVRRRLPGRLGDAVTGRAGPASRAVFASSRVSEIELDGHSPTLDTVDVVAAALGVSAAALLTPQAEDGTP